MPTIAVFKLRAVLEDGTEFDVTTDQRDAALWELQPFGCPFTHAYTKFLAVMRFMTWSAAKRNGLTKLDWAAFDAQCVEVLDQEQEDDEASDPGQAAASGTT